MSGRLAQCHLAIGKQQRVLGDLNAAMASFMASRMILEELTNRKPEQGFTRRTWPIATRRSASSRGMLESGDSGLEILEKAKKLQQALMNRFPANTVYRKRMAEIINALSFVYSQRFDYTNASRCFEEVQQICQSLLSEIGEGPKPVRLLDLMALAQYNMAEIHEENRKFAAALELSEKSLANRRALVAAHSSVTSYQENLGKSYCQVGSLQHKAVRNEEAFASLAKSIAILEKLTESEPGQARYHAALARSWNLQGFVRDELGKNEQAIPDFQNAVAEQKAAIIRSPDDSSYKVFLGWYLENLGEQFVDLGQVEAGLPYYLEARDRRRQLHDSHPEKDEYSEILGNGLTALGVIYRHAGDRDAARDTLAEAPDPGIARAPSARRSGAAGPARICPDTRGRVAR